MSKGMITFLNWKQQLDYWNEFKEFNQDGECERCEIKTNWVIANEDGVIGCWYCLFRYKIKE